MKNYPLNAFINKYRNWTNTYLKEINTKIFALKNYSDFFLTDFVPTDVSYDIIYVKESELPLYIVRIQELEFHNYASVSQDCYIYSDSTDSSALIFTDRDHDNKVYYLRSVPAGATIISNARAEGSIDANGITKYLLTIWNRLTDAHDLVTIENSAQLMWKFPEYGPPNAERTNWKNFVVQPTGFASLYSIEPLESGLKFIFYGKGGEEYGTQMDMVLLFDYARYVYLGSEAESRTFTDSKTGLTLYSKSATSNTLIGTPIQGIDTEPVHWIARNNPLLSQCYMNRTRPTKNSNVVSYGEEIIVDYDWQVSATKLVTVNTLVYNMTIDDHSKPTVKVAFDVEIL